MTITRQLDTRQLDTRQLDPGHLDTGPLDGDIAGLDVRPLSATIGAEIHGIDLSQPLADHQIEGVRAALRRWRVVFFRGQQLDHASQIALGRQFGDLTYAHPHDDTPPEGHPEIYTVDPRRFTAGLDQETVRELRRKYSYTSGWHTDVTPAVNPPAASILRAETVPPYGGDTTFTNLVAAYHGLSEPLRALADGLRAEHWYGANRAPNGVPQPGAYSGRIDQNRLVTHHPVVRVIPETGERALFVNPVFTGRIVDVHPDESRRLLELFFDQLTRRGQLPSRLGDGPGRGQCSCVDDARRAQQLPDEEQQQWSGEPPQPARDEGPPLALARRPRLVEAGGR